MPLQDGCIPYNKPFIVGKELYNIAQAVIESHLSGDGPFTKLCHQWLEDHLKCQKALLTHSCTAALEMAAILCEIQPGDEVIMPSFTFVSTANAFVLRGAVPVFIDIRPDTLNIDESKISRAITPKTKAIVPVHYAGIPCAMGKILEIANQKKLWVIEDAAQALLSKYKDQNLGTIGHLGCLSFHETKNIISGEGGALLVNDERFIDRAEIIREKGTNRNHFLKGDVDKYTWVDIGSSFLPSELVGAFLYAQFEMAEKIISVRCKIFKRYYQLLKPFEERGIIRLPYIEELNVCNGHIFYIILRSNDERTRLIDFLKKFSIYAIFHYIPLHTSPAGIKFGRTNGDLSNTESLSYRILRLPMYYEMSNDEIEKVVEKITVFFSK
jgi:dTDP-4-amino-4,6-dideoxygalactose transaminase